MLADDDSSFARADLRASVRLWWWLVGLPRLRGVLSGTSYLAAVATILSVSMGFHAHANAFPVLSFEQAMQATLRASVQYAAGFLLPLPPFVIAANLASERGRFRLAWLAAVAVVFGWVCTRLVASLRGIDEPTSYIFVPCCALAIVHELHGRAARGAQALLQARINCVRLDAELKRANLQQLRAQVEPHFLFNTLATIHRLAQVDTQMAMTMTADLGRYFAAALPSLRQDETSLADELGLVTAYLDIHSVRMGERLSYSLDVPAETEDIRLPTMALLTLVENAIKHGITPKVEGGAIRISARETTGTMQIRVADSGRGLVAHRGYGMGLENVQARLAALYGDAGRVRLVRAEPSGAVATLTFPARRG